MPQAISRIELLRHSEIYIISVKQYIEGIRWKVSCHNP